MENETWQTKCEKAKYCRAQKIFDKDYKKAILAMEGLLENWRRAVVGGLIQTGAIRKHGRAPPGYMENEMQELFEVFLSHKEDEIDE